LPKEVAAHPLLAKWVAGPPPWPIWGGRTTLVEFGGDPATPDRPYGVVRPPLKGLETKKKKKGLGFGGGRITPKGFEQPPDRPYGVVKTTPRRLGPWGWSGHPPPPKFQTFFGFVFWPFKGGRGNAGHPLSFF
jgi:hypothetical protein